MTVVQYGLETIDEAYVLPSILGKKDDVGYWVGCSDDSKPPKILPEEKFLHRIDLTVSQVRKNNEVEARVRLFAIYPVPEYLVIVGRLKDDWEKRPVRPK